MSWPQLRPGAAIGQINDLLRGIGRSPIDDVGRPGLFGGLARFAGSMSTTMAEWPPIFRCKARHIRPSPPAPMMTVGSVVKVSTFFKAPKVVTPEQASGAARSGARSPMSNR